MDVIRKDATITNTDDAFPGSFRVVLSAPTKDRDGDTLKAEEWKQPLPDHITFDQDHEMSVKGTVGSGRPFLDTDGRLIVEGTYSSLKHAQDVRTLVKEGHINRTSVAFMSEKTQKDGASVVTRELLNGAFVAVPSNREAVILESKSATVKTGARNSAADQAHLDAIHVNLTEAARHAVALGAVRSDGDDPQGGDNEADLDLAAAKTFHGKTAPAGYDPHAVVASIDAVVDQMGVLLTGIDTTTLPTAVQQALDLIPALDTTVDELMDALGIPDPDDEDDSAAAPAPDAPAAKAATVPAPAPATVSDTDSVEKQARAARMRLYATLRSL